MSESKKFALQADECVIFPYFIFFRFLDGAQQLLDKWYDDDNGHAEANIGAQSVYYALLLLTIRHNTADGDK